MEVLVTARHEACQHDDIDTVRADLMRDFIFETLAPVERDAGAARLCLQNNDDAGSRYHLKRVVEHVKAAAATFRELEALTRDSAARQA
jgi:hypothetical protein